MQEQTIYYSCLAIFIYSYELDIDKAYALLQLLLLHESHSSDNSTAPKLFIMQM